MAQREKSARGEKRRQDILRTARARLLTVGYADLSVRDVAGEVGISVGNLQYYFPTKDDLVEAVLLADFEITLRQVETFEWQDEQPVSQLTPYMRMLLDHFAGEAGRLYLMTAFLALHSQRFSDLLKMGLETLIQQADAYVGRAVPDADPETRASHAQIIVALIDGVVFHMHSMKNTDTTTLETLAQSLTTAIGRIVGLEVKDG